MTVKELKLKAAIKQATIDLCDGHIFEIYKSQIGLDGSACCVRCGLRIALSDLKETDKTVYEKPH